MTNNYDAVIAALANAEAYPEGPAALEHVQTHISHLLLTPDYVYKIKKPVDFGFLDFTTFEKRRHFCQRELELNRRLSPQVYLDVVEVRQDHAGVIRLGGAGRVVEHALKMRRLPQDTAMTVLLQDNHVTEDMVRELALLVARFHQRAETGPSVSVHGSVQAITRQVRENFSQTERYRRRTILQYKWHELREWSEAFLKEQGPLLRQRVAEGRVRDNHGDLHTAQVFFTTEGIRIIDCIEFNDAYRCCDVASDIGFLAMDLDANGRHDLSRVLVETWLEETGDREALQLLDFYKAYRAMVRGKVESFRLDDPGTPEAERDAITLRARGYFNLAYRYAQQPAPPLLVICGGMIGTGKSTVARYLANDTGMGLIATDAVRKQLAGARPTERHYDAFESGIYTPEFSARTYQEVFRQGRQFLEEGRSVVLDATFGRREHRETAAQLAQEFGADFWAIECVADESDLRERLARREARGQSVSDGRWDIYVKERESFEPMTEVPSGRHVVVRTTGKPVRESVTLTQQQMGLYRSWR